MEEIFEAGATAERVLVTTTGIPNLGVRAYPQVIKYMGSKAAILPFIATGLNKINCLNRPLVDLFAGACAISGGFGHRYKVVSNDIQEYSSVIGSVYLRPTESIGEFDIISLARPLVDGLLEQLPSQLSYSGQESLTEFNEIEQRSRELLNHKFGCSHHLFTQNYSGTWWSAEQCVWIDSIRSVLDTLLGEGLISLADFNFGLTCLLHAMAYSSQGTGHYAQYRDASTNSTMIDIYRYRRVSVANIFSRKFSSLLRWSLANVIENGHETTSADYRSALATHSDSVVYADPPYAFVHYSRFYHAMETAVKYDYPELQVKGGSIVKGRYRVGRHQSPFCIKSEVRSAFISLFEGISTGANDLILSYSNTGMIDIQDLLALANDTLGPYYSVEKLDIEYSHKTMGRRADNSRVVEESLIIAKRR